MVLNRTIFTHDNLPIMRGMNSESIDLIYLDPPFNSKHDYAAPIGSQAAGAAFKDTWTLKDVDETWHKANTKTHPKLHQLIEAVGMIKGNSDKAYLIYMAERLIEMRRLLKGMGSFYYHCDPTMGHSVKLLLDSIFGRQSFRRELIWNLNTTSGYKSQVKGYVRGHDTLLYYTKSATFLFNKEYRPHHPDYIARFRKVDEQGRNYRDDRSGKRRQYLDETPGVALTDVWSDVMSFQQHSISKELTGYPTQKPLALLRRIIKASSNPGDMVMDPFCGCATTLVAAEQLQRQWIGIDISAKAVDLVKDRTRKEVGLHDAKGKGALLGQIIPRTDIPQRTDLGKLPAPKSHKESLYGQQGGYCRGCVGHFQSRHMEIDHIVPKSKGGNDHKDNLQLLCGSCNKIKGDREMKYLTDELQNRDWMAARESISK